MRGAAAALVLGLAAGCAQRAPRVLVCTLSAGFEHEVVRRPSPPAPSIVEQALADLAGGSGGFEVELAREPADFEPGNLARFDAVLFYTTGELPLSGAGRAALFGFVSAGGGFVGVHSATDTFHDVPEYGELIGGYFDLHPWHQEVNVKVEDRNFPATRHFPPTFTITDEIYQFKNWSRDRVKVLMSLDNNSVDVTKKDVRRADKDFAVAWYRQYGKGRVFYCSLGHRNSVWDRPDIQKMWLEAMRWALGQN